MKNKEVIKSHEGQRALVEAYEAVSELLPETPAAAWRAWIRLGRRVMSNALNR